MNDTLRSAAHVRLITLLRETRMTAGLTQTEVASVLGKPQSYIAKVETGERRLDVVEFIQLVSAIRGDPEFIVRQTIKANIKR